MPHVVFIKLNYSSVSVISKSEPFVRLDMLIQSALILIGAALEAGCAVTPVIYEGFEMCVDPEEHAKALDFSNMKIFAETDTDVFLNGSLTVLKGVESPWKWTIFAEKFEREQWHVAVINRVIPDFCKVIQKPTEPWYYVTKKLEHKYCPFPAGVSLKLTPQSQLTFFSLRRLSTSTNNS
jgi:hypothetical protein